jgi:hypothetical protein
MLTENEERDNPTDEIRMVLFDFEQVPVEAEQVVLELTVKSGDGAEMETEVRELEKEECKAKGVLKVRVMLEF